MAGPRVFGCGHLLEGFCLWGDSGVATHVPLQEELEASFPEFAPRG